MLTTQQEPTTKIPLADSVYTIQGEGTFQGHAAYFIRLGGCDVGCPWCDTKYTWKAANHAPESVEKIAEKAANSGCSITVVTGGEPTLYNLLKLTECLKHKGLRTHLETAGVHPLTGEWDWICFSPKKAKAPLPAIYNCADELKIVVCDENDLQWAEQHAVKTGKHCALFLQPEWSQKKSITPLIVDYIKTQPQWKISLQIHKYIHIP